MAKVTPRPVNKNFKDREDKAGSEERTSVIAVVYGDLVSCASPGKHCNALFFSPEIKPVFFSRNHKFCQVFTKWGIGVMHSTAQHSTVKEQN